MGEDGGNKNEEGEERRGKEETRKERKTEKRREQGVRANRKRMGDENGKDGG